jgi:hypothetical protein
MDPIRRLDVVVASGFSPGASSFRSRRTLDSGKRNMAAKKKTKKKATKRKGKAKRK